jgi:hypothetical protein
MESLIRVGKKKLGHSLWLLTCDVTVEICYITHRSQIIGRHKINIFERYKCLK